MTPGWFRRWDVCYCRYDGKPYQVEIRQTPVFLSSPIPGDPTFAVLYDVTTGAVLARRRVDDLAVELEDILLWADDLIFSPMDRLVEELA